MRSLVRSCAGILVFCVIGVNPAWGGSEVTPEALQFFEAKIRPVLVERCYRCHQDKQRGGLRVDSREGLVAGGDSGPAIDADKPESSFLLKAIRHEGDDLAKMPPDKKLPQTQIDDLARWVKMGAPWPEMTSAKTPAKGREAFRVTDADRAAWAFRKLVKPEIPKVADASAIASPIDAFLLQRLEAKGLRLNPAASKRDLLRRLSYDLIGLPPTPEELQAFEQDPSPDAYERQVDRLLGLPQYGERWGRHWLDVVRFAQTNGYERDDEKPFAWRYRDYVIQAFNEDKPYDQFVREQLAGDLVTPWTASAQVATGFYRLGTWDDEADDMRQAGFDDLDDILGTTTQAFLGLTVNCARCHDHKFDPIAQKDYYKLLTFFHNIKRYETPQFGLASKTLVPLGPPDKVDIWQKETNQNIQALEVDLKAAKDEHTKYNLNIKLNDAKALKIPFEAALSVSENQGERPKTHVLIRGNSGTPGDEVSPGFPEVFDASGSSVEPSRMILADWVASPDNPLTARVLVNRIWQHHFARGIVPTPNDFGKAGIPPSHPELLDWLASTFIADGWKIKSLHKRILLSNAYRMSTANENPDALKIDEGNTLYWRQNLRRLEAEAIHDSALAVAGNLNPKMGGRGVFPRLTKEVIAGASRPGRGWELSSDDEHRRRAVYFFVKRTMLVPDLEGFDYTNTTSTLGDRSVTTVAPQALLMLNSEFFQNQADVFARRLERECPNDRKAQLKRAYLLATGREPSAEAERIALAYLDRQTAALGGIKPIVEFEPLVPSALYAGYLSQLAPTDFLRGPRSNWAYQRGRWGNRYEEIDNLETSNGPYALWRGAAFNDGTIETQVKFRPGLEVAALIVNGTEADGFTGYDLLMNPKEATIALRRHQGDKIKTLAEGRFKFDPEAWQSLKVDLVGTRFRVWAGHGDEPLLDTSDPDPLPRNGHLGFRTWGAGLSVRELYLTTSGKRSRVDDEPTPTPEMVEHRALASLALVILNLNDVVYVK